MDWGYYVVGYWGSFPCVYWGVLPPIIMGRAGYVVGLEFISAVIAYASGEEIYFIIF